MVQNSSKTELINPQTNKIDNALIEIVLELIFGHKMALDVHTDN